MKDKIIKINLGCGPDGINGWRNYDWGLLPLLNKLGVMKYMVKLGLIDKNYLVKWPKFELCDIRKGLLEADESVDFVYCSHVLEHFERLRAKDILIEVRRILKKNGIFRIVLPDLRLVTKINNADQMCQVWWGYDKSKIGRIARFFVREHRWMYDLESIKKLLLESGFKHINQSKYRDGSLPDLEKLDLKIHRNLSLYVEAKK